MFNLKKKNLKELDIWLLLSTIFLSIFGLIVLYSAFSGDITKIKSQIIATVIGFAFIILICATDLDTVKSAYRFFYVISLLLLGLTLVIGRGADQRGSNSWIIIGPVSFQPSELTKIAYIFFFARYFEKYGDKINKPKNLILTLILALLPIGLILLQPDFGTAMVYIFIFAVMVLVAGLDLKRILTLAIIAVVSMVFILKNMTGYRADRINDFLNPSRDTSGSGRQQYQGLIAIGSGGLTGRGYMQGSQSQYGYVPEKETDYIFSVLAEEFGFVGAFLMLLAYIILLLRLITVAKRAGSSFSSFLVSGIAALFFIHVFENVGMTIGIMPVTGIPLPFFSSGGTFQMLSLINIGFALSASMQKSKFDYEEAEIETIQFGQKNKDLIGPTK